ncbi:hypothetical protein I3843_10G131800 [Carya illinoinensis]|nr:hypothetical protein I3843_10G131800 [Carya illinoinensis]
MKERQSWRAENDAGEFLIFFVWLTQEVLGVFERPNCWELKGRDFLVSGDGNVETLGVYGFEFWCRDRG